MDNIKLELLKYANNKLNISDDITIEKNRNLIFVYTPPKVGSTSLITSIRIFANEKFNVFHIHDETMLSVLCGINNITINEIIEYNNLLGKNVYVIDIYRSPIEHKISIFYEKIGSYHFNNLEENVNTYNVNKIIKRFNKVFPYLANYDYYRTTYNIPIVEGFDFNKKYLIQNINGIKYIKLRLKDSQYWGNILSEILGTHVMIVKDYETEKKPTKDIFKLFKEIYKIPNNLFSLIENCNILKNYYSIEEREEYLNSWRTKICEDVKYFNEIEYSVYNDISCENKYINDIQIIHYIDEGCSCHPCNKKRIFVRNKINSGWDIQENDKIEHSQANKENNIEKITIKKQKLIKLINSTNMNIKQKNEKKMKLLIT
jgi:hypothetical protein